MQLPASEQFSESTLKLAVSSIKLALSIVYIRVMGGNGHGLKSSGSGPKMTSG